MIALPLGRVFEAKRVDKRVETRLNLSWTTATSSKESQDEFQDEIEGNTTKPGTSIVEIPGILSGWRDLNPRPLEKGIQFIGIPRALRVFGGIAMFFPSSFFPSTPDETPVIP